MVKVLLRKAAVYFVLCIPLSLIAGLLYVVLLAKFVPSDDLAYGQSLSQTFSDPFVLVILLEGSLILGFLAWLLACVFLLRVAPLPSVGIVGGSVLVHILLVTPLSPPWAFVTLPVTLFAAILFARHRGRRTL